MQNSKLQFKIKNLSPKLKTFNFSLLTFNFEKGQALVTLLFFVIISLTITSAAVIIIIINSISASKSQEGALAYYAAESGVENALLRILRDHNYTGETLVVGGVTVIVTVEGSDLKNVISVSRNGDFKRTIQAQMYYNNGYYTVSSWKEI
ncbi:MAG: hypothetical protein Q8P26_02745 [Candidatus Levybacteria bacterium]|nr:hypothetical protein [Candidatus Levybacteria bacterium]